MDAVYALIPYSDRDCSIVEVGGLLLRLAEGNPFNDAVLDSGIDTFDDRGANGAVERIRQLNAEAVR